MREIPQKLSKKFEDFDWSYINSSVGEKWQNIWFY